MWRKPGRSSIAETYSRSIYEGLGYFGTWPPSMPIDVGNVGHLDGSTIVVVNDLHSLGVDFSVTESSSQSLIYITRAVTIRLKAPGQLVNEAKAIPLDQAGVGLSFEKRGEMALVAQGCKMRSIENVADIASQILELRRRRLWHEDFVLVPNVVRAASFFALVAGQEGANAEITANRHLASTELTLDNIVARGRIEAENGITFSFLSHDPSTPFFRASRMGSRRSTKWGSRSVVAAEGDINGEDNNLDDSSTEADLYEVVPGVGLPDE